MIHYFGVWPAWKDLFFETLKNNHSIQFLIFTDQILNDKISDNIFIKEIEFQEFIDLASQKLNLPLKFENPYKICDLRPFLGIIHEEELKGSDFFGYADNDILFGDIRSFYDNDILSKYDVLSTHEEILSGHFSLFRNTRTIKNMYKFIGGYKEKLLSTSHVGMDEDLYLKAFKKYNNSISSSRNCLHRRKKINLFLKEQYTTPFSPIRWLNGEKNNHPENWILVNGKITNTKDGRLNFMYLHLMNFKSSKYRFDGFPAPWEKKKKIFFLNDSELKKGALINPNGIFPFTING